jgi:hypothetical protein
MNIEQSEEQNEIQTLQDTFISILKGEYDIHEWCVSYKESRNNIFIFNEYDFYL